MVKKRVGVYVKCVDVNVFIVLGFGMSLEFIRYLVYMLNFGLFGILLLIFEYVRQRCFDSWVYFGFLVCFVLLNWVKRNGVFVLKLVMWMVLFIYFI